MSETALSSLGENAVRLADEGWAVFPLAPRSKVPLSGTRGFKDASSDPDEVRARWLASPDSNIGVAAGDVHEGGSGVWSIDFDTDGAKDGLAVRARLEAEHGPLGGLVLETARGVQHVFIFDDRSPDRPRSGLEPGVDVRSTGSYFLAPPSVHPSGKVYRWTGGGPERAPGWLCAWIAERSVHEPPGDPGPPAGANGTRPYSDELFDEYRQMLGYVRGHDHADWLRVGFAIFELGWGDRGFALWDAWSRNWPGKYDPAKQRGDWHSFSRGYGGPRTTIASIAQAAMRAGWRPLRVVVDDLEQVPVPFFDRSEHAGPAVTIDELFDDAPRLATYLHAARDYLQVPESTIALAHLAGLSGVVAKRLVIDNGKFRQPPVLWLLSLMRTGGRKSEIVDLVREPILEVAASSRARELREAALEQQQTLNEELSRVLASPVPDHNRAKQLRYELVRNRGRTFDVAEMIVSDTTEAGLQEALLQSGGACFICDGEAATLNNAISPAWAKSGAVPQTTTWLNAFSGKSIKVKRSDKRRRQGLIRHPELAICLIVQTGSPTAYLFEHEHLRDSGFMARFLIEVPDFRPEDIEVDAPRPAARYVAPWTDLVESYLLSGIPLEPQVVHFHQDAAARFLEFRRLHQAEFRPGGANHDLPEFHNKAQGTLSRVAGLIATARAFEELRFGSGFTVELRDVERALALFPKLVAHARLAFGLEIDRASDRAGLRALHAIVARFPGQAFSARDLLRRWRGLRSSALREALEVLVESRWILPENEQRWRMGDTRARFRLNPRADLDSIPDP